MGREVNLPSPWRAQRGGLALATMPGSRNDSLNPGTQQSKRRTAMTRILLSSLAVAAMLSANAALSAAGGDYYLKMTDIAGEQTGKASAPKKATPERRPSTLSGRQKGQRKSSAWPSKIELPPPAKKRR
jgi:hypothetical protein